MSFAAFFLVPLAFVASVVLGLLALAATHRHRGSDGVVVGAFALPFVLLGYLIVAFFIYSAFVTARGTDTGWFDFYRTPLGGGFYADGIDSSNNTRFLSGPGLSESNDNENAFAVQRLGCLDDRPVAVTTTRRPEGGRRTVIVLLDPKGRRFETFASLTRLPSSERRLIWGTSEDLPSRCSPSTWPDVLVAFILWIGVPLLTLVGLGAWIVQVRRGPLVAVDRAERRGA